MRRWMIGWLAAVGLLLVALPGAACDFFFSYSVVESPLGTVGEIGVRVQKTHGRCTLPSNEEYRIDGENVQILGETAWEDMGGNLFEKWLQVSLSEVGEGFLRISKECSKEGYEEARLPIVVLAPTQNGVWGQAVSGTYPLTAEGAGTPGVAVGEAVIRGTRLSIDGISLGLAGEVSGLASELPDATVFFDALEDGEGSVLLIAAQGWFVRYDHLMDDGG